MATWHPGASRVPYPDAGAFTVGKPKLVWHTTEGTSLPRYSGSAPHFTFDPKTGKLWQHVPVDRASSSLVHPPSVETNHAHAIQVELVGFSDEAMATKLGHPERAVVNFTDADYKRIADLARWIEANANVQRRCGVKFVRYPSASYPRLSPTNWLDYAGHLGHQHVPGNLHGDPSLLDIAKVLAQTAHKASDYPGHVVDSSSHGGNVKTVQRWLNDVRDPKKTPALEVDGDFGPATLKRVRQFQGNHQLKVDGVVGYATWAALRSIAKNN